jgi:hypothetical protein
MTMVTGVLIKGTFGQEEKTGMLEGPGKLLP